MFLSVAFAALAASPALAQATPMVRQTPAYTSQRVVPGHMHYGYAQYGATSGVVSPDSRVTGQDPDPNIQLQLRRDPVADY